jgi:hypothetical protein
MQVIFCAAAISLFSIKIIDFYRKANFLKNYFDPAEPPSPLSKYNFRLSSIIFLFHLQRNAS